MCETALRIYRGKLLNVRDASAVQITGNAEIQNIKQILGLQHGKVTSIRRVLHGLGRMLQRPWAVK